MRERRNSSVAFDNLGSDVTASNRIHQVLESKAHGRGTIRYHPVGNESIDLIQKSLVNLGHEARHPQKYADWLFLAP
jgi:hypothetical protein